jgi:hypothetical protein
LGSGPIRGDQPNHCAISTNLGTRHCALQFGADGSTRDGGIDECHCGDRTLEGEFLGCQKSDLNKDFCKNSVFGLNQKVRFSVLNQKVRFSVLNQKLRFSFLNQKVRFSVLNQKVRFSVLNQKVRFSVLNQKVRYSVLNQKFDFRF